MFKFGKRSLRHINTCHEDLQIILHEAIKDSRMDFGVSEGYRSIERQEFLFNTGKSKVRKGKHNFDPSQAVYIYAYIPGKRGLAYNIANLAYLGGVITSTAKRLLREG